MFSNSYQNRRVLITGHTGFKGSWLTLWLQALGADITGLALAPESAPNHWDLLQLDINEHICDIRNFDKVSKIVKEAKPEIIFHLAAQSLVRRSYKSPRDTWETNVIGSCNLLDACRDTPEIKGIVFVTTDKCYDTKSTTKKYSEGDKLGGHDPYSASKSSCELLVDSYRDSFFKDNPLITTVRAGNVIGGGDWSEDRIIPDWARAQARNEDLIVRAPDAVRPWQHVLEPLSGYLQLGEKLLLGDASFQGPWNFGPDEGGILRVADLLDRMEARWKPVLNNDLHETKILMLDSEKARNVLSWRPIMSIEQQIEMTAVWYKTFLKEKRVLSLDQIKAYQNLARHQKAVWAK